MRMKHYMVCALTAAGMLTGCRSRDEVPFSTDPVENIEALWQIIDTKYCYIEDKGINWAAIHDEYVVRAQQVKKDDPVALFDLCAGMLDSLRDGHVNLYSDFDISVNTAWYDTFPANYDARLRALYLHDYRIAGGLNYCTIDEGRVGYVYYGSFSDGFSSANMKWVFAAMSDCMGLIIDVRNNGGGAITNAYRLAAPFFADDQTIGYWQHKTGPAHDAFSVLEPMTLDASAVAQKWDKPVVVLCNRRSYSATNLFVSMMRYAERATIIGGMSGGGGGMPMSYELPCGWMVRFSSVRMFDRDTVSIEEGIRPDIEMRMISQDKDDLIEQAIAVIRGE